MQSAGCVERRKHARPIQLRCRANVIPGCASVKAAEHRAARYDSENRSRTFGAVAYDRAACRSEMNAQHIRRDGRRTATLDDGPVCTAVVAAPEAVFQTAVEDDFAVVRINFQALALGSPGSVWFHGKRQGSRGELDPTVGALVDIPSQRRVIVLEHVRSPRVHCEEHGPFARRVDRDTVHAADHGRCRQVRGHPFIARAHNYRPPLASIPAVGIADVGPAIANVRIVRMRDKARDEPTCAQPDRLPVIERRGRFARLKHCPQHDDRCQRTGKRSSLYAVKATGRSR
jgi:hypothetical protein